MKNQKFLLQEAATFASTRHTTISGIICVHNLRINRFDVIRAAVAEYVGKMYGLQAQEVTSVIWE